MRQPVLCGIPGAVIHSFVSSGRKNLTTEVAIDAEIAAHWLDAYRYPKQRPLKNRKVEEYRTALRNNDFGVIQPIVLCLCSDENYRPYLLDGQHRLHGIREEDVVVDFQVAVIIRTRSEMEGEYLRLDRGINRSDKDVILPCGVFDNSSLQVQQQVELIQAVKLVLCKFDDPTSGWADKAIRDRLRSAVWVSEQISEWIPYAETYFGACKESDAVTRRTFGVRSLMSVMLVVLKHQPEKGFEFWSKVASNDGLRAKTPEHCLLNKVIYPSRGSSWPVAKYVRMVAACWNACYQELDPYHFARADEKMPVKIMGTPYKGEVMQRGRFVGEII